jgi:CRISPR-associated protein Csd2
MPSIRNRFDFVYMFDVTDGNPNGDPDAGNLPRLDPEDGRGLVTDVCLKRKVRNYVAAARKGQPGYEIYVTEGAILNQQHKRAYEGAKIDPGSKAARNREAVESARTWMCKTFYDIRTFGAVMTTDVNAGQVLGPVQLTFARSIDRIVPAEHSITRMAVTTEREAEEQEGGNRTMGRKATIPYALYRTHGFVNVPPAERTGFADEDLELFWEALGLMFDLDRSAARGLMAPRALVAFKHASSLGNAPASQLLARVKVERKSDAPPRDFSDYSLLVQEDALPRGVEVLKLI